MDLLAIQEYSVSPDAADPRRHPHDRIRCHDSDAMCFCCDTGLWHGPSSLGGCEVYAKRRLGVCKPADDAASEVAPTQSFSQPKLPDSATMPGGVRDLAAELIFADEPDEGSGHITALCSEVCSEVEQDRDGAATPTPEIIRESEAIRAVQPDLHVFDIYFTSPHWIPRRYLRMYYDELLKIRTQLEQDAVQVLAEGGVHLSILCPAGYMEQYKQWPAYRFIDAIGSYYVDWAKLYPTCSKEDDDPQLNDERGHVDRHAPAGQRATQSVCRPKGGEALLLDSLACCAQ